MCMFSRTMIARRICSTGGANKLYSKAHPRHTYNRTTAYHGIIYLDILLCAWHNDDLNGIIIPAAGIISRVMCVQTAAQHHHQHSSKAGRTHRIDVYSYVRTKKVLIVSIILYAGTHNARTCCAVLVLIVALSVFRTLSLEQAYIRQVPAESIQRYVS